MNLIYTICCGNDYQQIAEISLPTFSNYAKKIKCDFLCYYGNEDYEKAIETKLTIGKLLEKYERVAFIDIDCIIDPESPNIFEDHPDTNRFYIRTLQFNGWFQINSGVMIVSKPHAFLFEKNKEKMLQHRLWNKIKNTNQSMTEKWLCCQLNDASFSVQNLERKWHEDKMFNPCYIFHAQMFPNKREVLIQQKEKKHLISIL